MRQTHPNAHYSRGGMWVIAAVLVILSIVAICLAYKPAPPSVDVTEEHPIPSVSVAPSTSPTTRPSPSKSATAPVIQLPKACRNTTTESFVPTKFTIPGEGSWPMIGLDRDANNRPATATREGLPLWSFIWDKEAPPPNYGQGVFYGGAHRVENALSLGNLMLRKLSVNDIVIFSAGDGQRLCLRMYERTEVKVEAYPEKRVFNVTRTPQEYVFDICSGVRRGPGDWSKATLMFFRVA